MQLTLLESKEVLSRLSTKRYDLRPNHIQGLWVPQELLSDTWYHLREKTNNRVESLALWVGQYDNQQGYVVGVLYPKVKAGPLRVEILDNERPIMGRWLKEQGLRVLAELHTHKMEAFLSEVDQAYPLVAQRGFVQVVVPYFAQGAMDWMSVCVFVLKQEGWLELNPTFIRSWEGKLNGS